MTSFEAERAEYVRDRYIRSGLHQALRGLADHTAWCRVHLYAQDEGAEPLTQAQAAACGRWVHALVDEMERQQYQRQLQDPRVVEAPFGRHYPDSGGD